MKKLLTCVLATFVMAGTAFSKGFYNGDIQIHLGLGLDDVSVEQASISQTVTGNSLVWSADLETWHIFNLNDVFGLGFMAGFNGGFGQPQRITVKVGNSTTSLDADGNSLAGRFNFMVGPAIGITCGNVVRFDVAFGLNAGFGIVSAKQTVNVGYSSTSTVNSYTISGVGFAAEIQAKFCPKAVVSPIIGYRFSSLFADSVSYYNYYGGGSGTTITLNNVKASYMANDIYFAISFNW